MGCPSNPGSKLADDATVMKRRAGKPWRVAQGALLLCLVLIATATGGGGVPTVRADDLASRIAAAKQRQVQLQKSIDRQNALLDQLHQDEGVAKVALSSTGDQLDQINTDQAAVRDQIAQATDALHRIQTRRDALAAELSQLDWTLSLLESEITQGAQDLATRQRMLGDRLAEAYRTQQTSLLEQVLSAGSFSDVMSNAAAYLAYGDQDAELAQGIQQDQASLDSLRRLTAATRYRTDQLRRDAQAAAADVRDQQAKLQAAKAKLAELESKTKAVQDDQLAAFHKINDTQAKVQAYLKEQAQAQAQLEKKIAGLVKEAQRRAAARERRHHSSGGFGSSGSGYFRWPTYGTISQEFGCTGFVMEPRWGSCAHFHKGIDIANGTGTPVRAAASGVVAFVGYNPYDYDPAFMVIIGHAHGLTTEYAHLLPRYLVHAGQYVSKGRLIGYMGNTGHSTGTHLHWQVEKNGVPVNPRNYT